jgi:DNA-binding beta-propeller fold protein YncE
MNRKVYAACHDGRTIDIIDCASDSVVARIGTSGNPWTLAWDRTDNLIYPGTSWGAPVICGQGDTVVADLSDPFYVKGITWEPGSNFVYMARNFSSDVLVVDAAVHQVRATLPVADYPADMTHLDSSGRVYVCHNRSGRLTRRVTVIEGDSVVAVFDLRRSPVGVVPDNVRGKAYVLSWESSCITVINDHLAATEEVGGGASRPAKTGATVVRGVLSLPRDMTEFGSANSDRVPRPALLDVAGRKVLDLTSGPNDVRHLPAGVYFLSGRMANGEWRVANKVVIQR